jgi:hypothetical protein
MKWSPYDPRVAFRRGVARSGKRHKIFSKNGARAYAFWPTPIHCAGPVILVKIEGAITPNYLSSACRRGAKVGGRSSTPVNELYASRRKIGSCASSNTNGHHATGRCPSWLEQKLKQFDRFELAHSNIRVGTGVIGRLASKTMPVNRRSRPNN